MKWYDQYHFSGVNTVGELCTCVDVSCYIRLCARVLWTVNDSRKLSTIRHTHIRKSFHLLKLTKLSYVKQNY